ncbi:hypothetical protein FOCG_17363 [Fusarium oxysporum f. sp. radicis-lycopersici 26381]|nr:hypothetical protein FOCG_17363 [Fusarium oxysporum f. sp. radicis-lycopersici 26381]
MPPEPRSLTARSSLCWISPTPWAGLQGPKHVLRSRLCRPPCPGPSSAFLMDAPLTFFPSVEHISFFGMKDHNPARSQTAK